jgi:hypothetical protein
MVNYFLKSDFQPWLNFDGQFQFQICSTCMVLWKKINLLFFCFTIDCRFTSHVLLFQDASLTKLPLSCG